jgi:hypothetical protein
MMGKNTRKSWLVMLGGSFDRRSRMMRIRRVGGGGRLYIMLGKGRSIYLLWKGKAARALLDGKILCMPGWKAFLFTGLALLGCIFFLA